MADDPTKDPLLSQLVKRVAALERAQRRGGALGSSVAACCIYGTAGTGIPSGVLTRVTLDGIDFDTTGAMADTANDRIVIVASGIYIAITNAEIGASAAAGQREGRIYRQLAAGGAPGNIVSYRRAIQSAAGAAVDIGSAMRPKQLMEGDVLTFHAFHNTTGTINVAALPEYTPFLAVVRLAPLP